MLLSPLFVMASCLCLLAVGAGEAQTLKEKQKILKAIRSGKLKVTDDMIATQRKANPEMKGMSNKDVRKLLDEKVKPASEKPFATVVQKVKPIKQINS